MPTVTVTRHVHFNAAHRLHNPALSDAENRSLFGPCNNLNYHGHNYELEISIEGEIDPRTGYVADLGVVKRIAEETVLAALDHKNLNLDVPEFRDLIPSAENIAVVIWRKLEGKLPGRLVKVALWETPRNRVEYRGD